MLRKFKSNHLYDVVHVKTTIFKAYKYITILKTVPLSFKYRAAMLWKQLDKKVQNTKIVDIHISIKI